MSKTDLPKPNVMAISHEPEGGIGLSFGNLGDIMPELFVGLARIARAFFCFHDSKNVAARVVETIIGHPVPWLGVITIYWNLQSNLGAVVKSPVGCPQLGVDLR